MIRAIVLDFGNVIGFFDHRRAIRKMASYTDVAEEALVGRLYDPELEDAYESGRLTTPEFLRTLRQRGGFRCSDDILADCFADIFWHNPEVCALIPELAARYRLVLGSNTTELHSLRFRQQFAEQLRYFHALVLSHEVGARKPRPAFYEHCCRRAGHRPDECLFIDDLPANVAGAEACGLRGMVYRPGSDLRGQLRAILGA
ncbi:MAG: HAD family phosphatase [Gemmataceae bacterium]|nr:HAD family phosphatase [Gemmataceae bacterium]MDW8263938.1 HAD family phosphatase [Gemmataceae bacterium]